jgi:hypothetical protein
MDDFVEAFIETEWLWNRNHEDYEPNIYDGTYGEG